MKLSLSEQLILGILSEQDRHGYEIEKIINERGMRKWTEVGFSSIYFVLDKLEAKGLATSTVTAGKEKKQFAITDTGISELKHKAIMLITERQPANSHLMTGLATSQLIKSTTLHTALKKRRGTLATDLAALQNKQSSLLHAPRSAQQLFSLSEALLRAELNWINEELKRRDKK